MKNKDQNMYNEYSEALMTKSILKKTDDEFVITYELMKRRKEQGKQMKNMFE
jgi:hypothetical protein